MTTSPPPPAQIQASAALPSSALIGTPSTSSLGSDPTFEEVTNTPRAEACRPLVDEESYPQHPTPNSHKQYQHRPQFDETHSSSSYPDPHPHHHPSSHSKSESDIDKYAPLFNPSTPRASPVLQPELETVFGDEDVPQLHLTPPASTSDSTDRGQAQPHVQEQQDGSQSSMSYAKRKSYRSWDKGGPSTPSGSSSPSTSTSLSTTNITTNTNSTTDKSKTNLTASNVVGVPILIGEDPLGLGSASASTSSAKVDVPRERSKAKMKKGGLAEQGVFDATGGVGTRTGGANEILRELGLGLGGIGQADGEDGDSRVPVPLPSTAVLSSKEATTSILTAVIHAGDSPPPLPPSAGINASTLVTTLWTSTTHSDSSASTATPTPNESMSTSMTAGAQVPAGTTGSIWDTNVVKNVSTNQSQKAKRRELVDEILLHEDDPLWFVVGRDEAQDEEVAGDWGDWHDGMEDTMEQEMQDQYGNLKARVKDDDQQSRVSSSSSSSFSFSLASASASASSAQLLLQPQPQLYPQHPLDPDIRISAPTPTTPTSVLTTPTLTTPTQTKTKTQSHTQNQNLKYEGEDKDKDVISHHLLQIDDDYFVQRMPAETLPLLDNGNGVLSPPAQEGNLGALMTPTFVGASKVGLVGEEGGVEAESQEKQRNVQREQRPQLQQASPSWSFRSPLSGSAGSVSSASTPALSTSPQLQPQEQQHIRSSTSPSTFRSSHSNRASSSPSYSPPLPITRQRSSNSNDTRTSPTRTFSVGSFKPAPPVVFTPQSPVMHMGLGEMGEEEGRDLIDFGDGGGGAGGSRTELEDENSGPVSSSSGQGQSKPEPLGLPSPVSPPVLETQPKRTSSYSTLGGWMSGFLGGPSVSASPKSDGDHGKQRESNRDEWDVDGATPVREEWGRSGRVQPREQGRGRQQQQHQRPSRVPLPRARPSLENIQNMHRQHELEHALSHPPLSSLSPPSSSAHQRSQSHNPQPSIPSQPVNITHGKNPFAPPPTPGLPALATPSSSSFFSIGRGTAGGRGGGSIGYAAGGSVGVHPNPFATHTFVPISGAPGFRPEEYDWDKGFSEELERELEGGGGNVDMGETTGGNGPRGAGGGARAGTVREGSGSSKSSSFGLRDDKSNSRLRLMNSTTTPTSSSRTSSRSPARVSELIEKKSGGVVLSGRKESTVGVLDQGLADLLRPYFPALSRLPRSWSLLYSLDQHGISLRTLYSNCEAPERNRKTGQGYIGIGGVVLTLKDSASEAQGGLVFGAYVPDGLGRKGKGFFGGGDSFLWKYCAGELKVFKATGRNSYFTICEQDYMGFGGGSTSYGLYIDSGLLDGSSAPCPTFGNEPLCIPGDGDGVGSGIVLGVGKEVEFECVGLEVWGVGP